VLDEYLQYNLVYLWTQWDDEPYDRRPLFWHGFLAYLQVLTKTLHQIKHLSLPSTSLPTHYSPISLKFDEVNCNAEYIVKHAKKKEDIYLFISMKYCCNAGAVSVARQKYNSTVGQGYKLTQVTYKTARLHPMATLFAEIAGHQAASLCHPQTYTRISAKGQRVSFHWRERNKTDLLSKLCTL